MNHFDRKRGISRVELLIIFAVVGTLLAFVVPALHRAREIARKNQCAKNIGSLALAQQDFRQAHGAFAPSNHSPLWKETLQEKLAWDRISWITSTLPYIEQSELYNQIEPFHRAEGTPWTTKELSDLPNPYRRRIPLLRCPADSVQITSTDCQPTNYVGNRGDVYMSSFDWEWRGTFGNGETGSASDASITDGLSNTLLLAELVIGRTTAESGKYSVIEGISLDEIGAPGTNWSPSTCAATRGPNNKLVAKRISESWADGGWGKGRRWGDAYQAYTGFFAILPPNSPTCAYSCGESEAMPSASSRHQGGAFVAMCDGSIRFISEKIDSGDAEASIPSPPENTRAYAGPSIWGVWGALGSANGGESLVSPE